MTNSLFQKSPSNPKIEKIAAADLSCAGLPTDKDTTFSRQKACWQSSSPRTDAKRTHADKQDTKKTLQR